MQSNGTKKEEKNDSLRNKFHKIYTDINSPTSYSRKYLDFLKHYKSSSVHKQVRKPRNFKARRIIVHRSYQILFTDLIEYTSNKFPGNNNNYRYILVVVDTFSKYAYAEPLRHKSGIEVAFAMKKILNKLPNKPQTIISDEG